MMRLIHEEKMGWLKMKESKKLSFKMNEVKRLDEKIILAVICFSILIFFKLADQILYSSSINSVNSPISVCFLVIKLILLIAVALCISSLGLKQILHASWKIYAFVVIFPFIAMIVDNSSLSLTYGMNNGWFMFGKMHIYMPALFTLIVFPLFYLIVKENRITVGYGLFITILCGLIPLSLYSCCIKYVVRIALLFFSFFVLIVKLKKDNRLKVKNMLFGMGILWVIGFLVYFLYEYVSHSHRFAAVLTRGMSDPYGGGYRLYILTSVLDKIKILGNANCTFTQLGDSIVDFSFSDSIADFFSFEGYFGVPVAMRFGWLPFAILLISTIVLIISLYKMGNAATNSYAKYFSFTCATFFLARTVYSVVSEFFFPNTKDFFLFFGGWSSFLVDAVLFFSVLIMYKRKEPDVVVADYFSELCDSQFRIVIQRLKNEISSLFKRIIETEIELTDSQGMLCTFIFLDLVRFEGKSYVILRPWEEEENHIWILELEEDLSSDEKVYHKVKDTDVVQIILAIYNEKWKTNASVKDYDLGLQSAFPINPMQEQ